MASDVSVTRDCPLVESFRRVAQQQQSSCAISGAHVKLTYGAFWDLVRAQSADLRSYAAPQRAVVVLHADKPAYLPIAFLAVRAAGLVPVILDTLLPAERRAAMVNAVRPAFHVQVRERPEVSLGDRSPMVLPEGAGYVVFSSGSQGAPKGIIGSDTGLIHFLNWEIDTLGLAPGTRAAMLSSPSFDVVLREMFAPLLSGGELHVAETGTRTAQDAVLPWLADHRIEIVHVVPSLTARWTSSVHRSCLKVIRWTLFAGEPLYSSHVEAWRHVAPNSRVVNLYGPSETTLARFWYPVPSVPRPGRQPVGRPLPGTYLGRGDLPDLTANPDAASEFRIIIETRHGSLGYLPDTATDDDMANLKKHGTRVRFVTQDRGRLDNEGLLHVEGRLDSRVKRRGAFVDIARIEELATSEAGVTAACCIQVDPEAHGDIILVIEARASALPAVRRSLRRRLGPAVPDDVIVFATLPLLSNGKVDRLSLHKVLREP